MSHYLEGKKCRKNSQFYQNLLKVRDNFWKIMYLWLFFFFIVHVPCTFLHTDFTLPLKFYFELHAVKMPSVNVIFMTEYWISELALLLNPPRPWQGWYLFSFFFFWSLSYLCLLSEIGDKPGRIELPRDALRSFTILSLVTASIKTFIFWAMLKPLSWLFFFRQQHKYVIANWICEGKTPFLNLLFCLQLHPLIFFLDLLSTVSFCRTLES